MMGTRARIYLESPDFRAPARLAAETERDLRAELRAVLRDARALVAEHKRKTTAA